MGTFIFNKQNNNMKFLAAFLALIAAKGGPNYDGSYDWGLFQVNDYYWCSGSGQASKYNDCNVSCNNLVNNNISDDCDCAKLIYKRHGFDAWYGWINGCKGKDTSSYISGCKL